MTSSRSTYIHPVRMTRTADPYVSLRTDLFCDLPGRLRTVLSPPTFGRFDHHQQMVSSDSEEKASQTLISFLPYCGHN